MLREWFVLCVKSTFQLRVFSSISEALVLRYVLRKSTCLDQNTKGIIVTLECCVNWLWCASLRSEYLSRDRLIIPPQALPWLLSEWPLQYLAIIRIRVEHIGRLGHCVGGVLPVGPFEAAVVVRAVQTLEHGDSQVELTVGDCGVDS
jgi:hypothetical protein